MMQHAERNQEALQLEALLLSRSYLWLTFHKLTGGTPNEELLDALISVNTQDAVEEYADGNKVLSAFAGLLEELRAKNNATFQEAAAEEYTRCFIGPAALPASPYESPYTGTHDMALFQENTLLVRKAYQACNLAPKRLYAVPDDHISLMCAFMAAQGQKALELFRQSKWENLASILRTQGMFVQAHMGSWLTVYASSVRNSHAGSAAVLYPQLLEALAAFAAADAAFLVESAYWTENVPDLPAWEPAPALADIEDALKALESIRPFGIEDNELVSLS